VTRVVGPALAGASVLRLGCVRNPNVDLKRVNEVIHVCKTDVRTVRAAFGPPNWVGMMNGVVTNQYADPVMIVAYQNDIVVDVVVNPPPGLVSIGNRCRHAVRCQDAAR
jgi:hypothetical protein